MKKTLKWIGCGLLILAALSALKTADHLTRWGIGIIAVLGWLVDSVYKVVEGRASRIDQHLERIERKLDQLLDAPRPDASTVRGLEDFISDYRKSVGDSDDELPSPTISGAWPFGR